MGRTYVRKTGRGPDGARYSRETLMRAVADVQNSNKTIKGASKFYLIPRTTLRHYLKGTRGKGVIAKSGSGGGGRMQLTVEQEQTLAQLLKTMEKCGFGLCKQEVLDVVQVFIRRNAIKTKFANDRPGNEWFLNFRKRNRLSIKKPQGVEYVRVNQTNPFTIYGFFDILCKKVNELNLLNKPHLIFNCDETSFCSDPSKTKVVGAVGIKSMRQISSAGRDNTTVLFCCSASGQKLPMLCVFKGKNIMETWMPDGPTDQTAFAASKKGWMDSIIFLNWFKKCFLPSIPLERPIILIFDGHVSHISSELIQTAIENEVTLLKLPPHTTHILQPLDVAVFKSLKTNWDRDIVRWQRENPRRKIPKDTFVKLLQKVYLNMPESNIISGFKSTGIYDPDVGGPNRSAISENIFRIDELRNYKNSVERNLLTVQNEDHDYVPPNQAENITNMEINDFGEPVTNDTSNETHNATEPLTNAMVPMTNLQNRSEAEPSTSKLRDTTKATNGKESTTFQEILMALVKGNRQKGEEIKKSRRRLCHGAELITSEEYAKKKQDEEKSRLEREKKITAKKSSKVNEPVKKRKAYVPVKKIRRNNKSDSDTETDNEQATLELSDSLSDSDSDVENIRSSIAVIEGDYVKVHYEGRYYPGKVLEICPSGIKISHMTSSGFKGKGWRWPEKADELMYDEEDILKIIQPPKPINNRGLFSVPEVVWE